MLNIFLSYQGEKQKWKDIKKNITLSKTLNIVIWGINTFINA